MTPVLPLHLGALHPVEQALTILLAFGPFVLLALVVWLRRREDDRLDAEDPTESADQGESAEGVRPTSQPPPAPGP
jgi:hypothetical protein